MIKNISILLLAVGAAVMEMYAGVTHLVVTHTSGRLSVTRYRVEESDQIWHPPDIYKYHASASPLKWRERGGGR